MTQDLPAHAVIRPLTYKDVDACLELENIVFENPAERCSLENLKYRLKVCPELCAGVFLRTFKDPSASEQDRPDQGDDETTNGPEQQPEIEDRDEDYEDIDDTESDDDGVPADRLRSRDLRTGDLPPGQSMLESEKLIGHILATKATSEVVTMESMDKPEVDEYGRNKDPQNDPRGHREEGRTICIHSVGVLPEFRGKSIATIMLKDYIQRITTQHIADRIALICHDHLMPFYSRSGFVDAGKSELTFGGQEWYNMWIPLSDTDDEDEE
uniref:ARAD1C05280p n=1 Tax=Blastobotrys adeninivorans TaxID=409370 RepID=A0A060SZ26_BLAAD